jgi:hypothetical protein
MWAPDVYEGAPTPITGYMAAAVKAAAFAAFFRVWIEAFGHLYVEWHDALWWLAVVTMFVGNLVALQQRNLKRMLAYSSIGHTGFLLVAITSATAQSPGAMLFYLFAYTLATMGAFAVIISLGTGDNPRERVDDYHGLWNERPGLAIAMTVFMLAMLGFPVFGGMGFFAKWYVLQTAIDAAAPQVLPVRRDGDVHETAAGNGAAIASSWNHVARGDHGVSGSAAGLRPLPGSSRQVGARRDRSHAVHAASSGSSDAVQPVAILRKSASGTSDLAILHSAFCLLNSYGHSSGDFPAIRHSRHRRSRPDDRRRRGDRPCVCVAAA